MRKIVLFIMLLMVLLISCKNEPDIKTEYADVNFTVDISSYKAGNIKTRIQYKSIPLFGSQSTAGREANWKWVEDEDGSFTLSRLEKGTWIFYVKVVDAFSGEPLKESFTGSTPITNQMTISFDDTPDLTNYSDVGIYVRADMVAANQTIKVTYESTATGAVFELSDVEWTIMKQGTTYIDYSVTAPAVPVGNYMFRIVVYGDDNQEVMSREDTVIVKSSGTEPLVVKLKAQSYEGGSLVIDDYSKYLDGMLTGPTEGTINEASVFRYSALNQYTEDNAVWFWWYVDGRRISTRDPVVEASFLKPGRYLISCAPIGINGEVPRYGSSVIEIAIGE